jgi:hypothetical protein
MHIKKGNMLIIFMIAVLIIDLYLNRLTGQTRLFTIPSALDSLKMPSPLAKLSI